MKKEEKKISTEYLVLSLGTILGVGFLILDSLGALSFLRSAISFVVDPIAYHGSATGGNVREYFTTFTHLNKFREEYNVLSEKLYEQEVYASFYAVLKEENESLKKQISLGDSEQKYVMAKVLNREENNFIRINKGGRDAIAVGDVVVLGNTYIGMVVNVDNKGSLVRLPSNRSSSLETIIVKGDIEEVRTLEQIEILSKGVVKGAADGIRIENMSMNASLRNGDVVVVNDVRVGEYLILGRLVGLSENPAATSRSGYVSPILDCNRLITVFVMIDS